MSDADVWDQDASQSSLESLSLGSDSFGDDFEERGGAVSKQGKVLEQSSEQNVTDMYERLNALSVTDDLSHHPRRASQVPTQHSMGYLHSMDMIGEESIKASTSGQSHPHPYMSTGYVQDDEDSNQDLIKNDMLEQMTHTEHIMEQSTQHVHTNPKHALPTQTAPHAVYMQLYQQYKYPFKYPPPESVQGEQEINYGQFDSYIPQKDTRIYTEEESTLDDLVDITLHKHNDKKNGHLSKKVLQRQHKDDATATFVGWDQYTCLPSRLVGKNNLSTSTSTNDQIIGIGGFDVDTYINTIVDPQKYTNRQIKKHAVDYQPPSKDLKHQKHTKNTIQTEMYVDTTVAIEEGFDIALAYTNDSTGYDRYQNTKEDVYITEKKPVLEEQESILEKAQYLTDVNAFYEALGAPGYTAFMQGEQKKKKKLDKNASFESTSYHHIKNQQNTASNDQELYTQTSKISISTSPKNVAKHQDDRVDHNEHENPPKHRTSSPGRQSHTPIRVSSNTPNESKHVNSTMEKNRKSPVSRKPSIQEIYMPRTRPSSAQSSTKSTTKHSNNSNNNSNSNSNSNSNNNTNNNNTTNNNTTSTTNNLSNVTSKRSLTRSSRPPSASPMHSGNVNDSDHNNNNRTRRPNSAIPRSSKHITKTTSHHSSEQNIITASPSSIRIIPQKEDVQDDIPLYQPHNNNNHHNNISTPKYTPRASPKGIQPVLYATPEHIDIPFVANPHHTDYIDHDAYNDSNSNPNDLDQHTNQPIKYAFPSQYSTNPCAPINVNKESMIYQHTLSEPTSTTNQTNFHLFASLLSHGVTPLALGTEDKLKHAKHPNSRHHQKAGLQHSYPPPAPPVYLSESRLGELARPKTPEVRMEKPLVVKSVASNAHFLQTNERKPSRAYQQIQDTEAAQRKKQEDRLKKANYATFIEKVDKQVKQERQAKEAKRKKREEEEEEARRVREREPSSAFVATLQNWQKEWKERSVVLQRKKNSGKPTFTPNIDQKYVPKDPQEVRQQQQIAAHNTKEAYLTQKRAELYAERKWNFTPQLEKTEKSEFQERYSRALGVVDRLQLHAQAQQVAHDAK